MTDPPYGINADKGVSGFGNTKGNKYDDDWDSFTPDKSFFDMILEMPKNAIIFGGNYFTDKLPLGKHWIVWDKVGEIDFQNPYSDCELAWTNIAKESVKKYTVIQQDLLQRKKKREYTPLKKALNSLHKLFMITRIKTISFLIHFAVVVQPLLQVSKQTEFVMVLKYPKSIAM